MHAYIFIHAYIHAYMHAYSYMHTYMYSYIHTYMHIAQKTILFATQLVVGELGISVFCE